MLLKLHFYAFPIAMLMQLLAIYLMGRMTRELKTKFPGTNQSDPRTFGYGGNLPRLHHQSFPQSRLALAFWASLISQVVLLAAYFVGECIHVVPYE